jgi:hypothetical protein
MISTSRKRFLVAGLELFLALFLMVGIWFALPARWWPIDVGGTLLGCLLAAGGLGLLKNWRVGWVLSAAVNWIALIVGITLVTVLAWTAAHLVGLYGPVGGGGALLLGAVAVLVLPYLVGLPALLLFILRPVK